MKKLILILSYLTILYNAYDYILWFYFCATVEDSKIKEIFNQYTIQLDMKVYIMLQLIFPIFLIYLLHKHFKNQTILIIFISIFTSMNAWSIM